MKTNNSGSAAAAAATTSSAPSSSNNATAAPIANAPFVLDQEIPNDQIALERAKASLRVWERHLDASRSSEVPFNKTSCDCPHILQTFPRELPLDFVLNVQTKSLCLRRPVHALHLASQGLSHLVPSSASAAAILTAAAGNANASQKNNSKSSSNSSSTQQTSTHHSSNSGQKPPPPQPPYPIALYGEEQERTLAAQLPGLSNFWHPFLMDDRNDDTRVENPPLPTKDNKTNSTNAASPSKSNTKPDATKSSSQSSKTPATKTSSSSINTGPSSTTAVPSKSNAGPSAASTAPASATKVKSADPLAQTSDVSNKKSGPASKDTTHSKSFVAQVPSKETKQPLPTTTASSSTISVKGDPQAPKAVEDSVESSGVLPDTVESVDKGAAVEGSMKAPATTNAPVPIATTSAGATFRPTSSADLSEMDGMSTLPFSEEDLQRYHAYDENLNKIRKALLGTRALVVAANPSGSNSTATVATVGSAAAAQASGAAPSSSVGELSGGPKRKKLKVDKSVHLTHLSTFQTPRLTTHDHVRFDPEDDDNYYKREQRDALRQAERWVAEYRAARTGRFGLYGTQRCTPAVKIEGVNARPGSAMAQVQPLRRKRRNYVFGAMVDSKRDTETLKCVCPWSQSRRQSEIANTALDQTMQGIEQRTQLHCLDCGHVACLLHMREHMTIKGHFIAVTPNEDPSRIYCFRCEAYVQCEVFCQEEEGLAVAAAFPWMAWDLPTQTHRSFDPLQFMRIPHLGIFWRGMKAIYPIPVAHHHIQAARMSLMRYQHVHGRYLSPPCLENGQVEEFRRALAEPILYPVGMYTLGNTCFQSAVFQCLVHCKPFQSYFLREVGHSHGSCTFLREKQHQELMKKMPSSPPLPLPVCMGCELDKLFLRYQSRSTGMNVYDVMHEINAEAVLISMDPAYSLALDGQNEWSKKICKIVGRERKKNGSVVPQGDPLTAQADLLVASWRCKEMAHLAGYEQRDAHEFLHAFGEVLGKHTQNFRDVVRRSLSPKPNLTNAPKEKTKLPNDTSTKDRIPPANLVHHLMQGTLRSVLLCEECGGKRIQKESFLSLSLDLSKEAQRGQSVHGNTENRVLSIEKGLLHFTATEKLADPVECPFCEKKTRTSKQHVISKVPQVLCLHLKRFHVANLQQKMDDFVAFPARALNMGPYLPHWREESAVGKPDDEGFSVPFLPYDLFATVNHFGNLQSGHYIANVKTGDQWYHCNDAYVGHSTEDEVLQSNAYMLFYVRSNNQRTDSSSFNTIPSSRN